MCWLTAALPGMNGGVRQGDPFLFLIVAEGLNLLTIRAVERGFISPVEVGRDKVKSIPYSWLRARRAVKWVLKFFEIYSGLTLNFDKCRIIGINMTDVEVSRFVGIFGCQMGALPLDYLGMKVGGRLNKLANWDGVVEQAKSRLSKWNASSLSMGGRVTLVNSVLSAIPIYRMALSHLPAGTADVLRKIQSRFLWGEGEGGAKKIAWIKWADVCKSKSEGGLGVKNLQCFNRGKWWWRYLLDKEKLWGKVIRSRYGDLSEKALKSRDARTDWWNKIVTALAGDQGRWFSSKLKWQVGDGLDTRFWEDVWCDEKPLKDCFPRLFRLSLNEDGRVGEMAVWEEGGWRWEFKWRRNLWDTEMDGVAELVKKIEDINLRAGYADR